MKPWLVIGIALLSGSSHAYEFDYKTIASGLNHPTSMIFLDADTALVSERNGGLRYVNSGTLDPVAIGGVPAVLVAGQAGLFDLALHPGFDSNRQIYLSYAFGSPQSNTLQVARATLRQHQLSDLEVVFSAEPQRDTAFHYGGRMAFLADGTLLVSSGEGFEYRERAQFLDSHFGKMLRIADDGSVPQDNPFVGVAGVPPEIYSFGHRNPQGLVVGLDNEIYAHEHGPQGGDEINLIKAGRNYGWPAITFGVDYSGAHVSPFNAYPGLEQPVLHWTPSIAPGGMTIYDGEEFPLWRGNLLVAALAERSVRRVVIEAGRVVEQEVLFTDLGQRLRDVRTGPDGAIYLLTDDADGKIIRVTLRE